MKGLSLLLLLFSALFISAPPASANEPPWVEARSPHFTVMTDTNAKQAVRLADHFERVRAVLHTVFPNAKVDAPEPILVLALKDPKAFEAVEPDDDLKSGQHSLAGTFQVGPGRNEILLRLGIHFEPRFATAYHEYTHFAFSSEEWMPLWLNEGIAEFMQSANINDKYVELGGAGFDTLHFLSPKHLIPLPILFNVDHTSPYYNEDKKSLIFYAESWALVHYLVVEDLRHHQDRISVYEHLLKQNQDPLSAATQAFGDLGELERGLQSYIRQGDFHHFRLSSPRTPDPASFQTADVSSADADLSRAEFLAYNGRAAEARPLLQAVLKKDPNSAAAYGVLGCIALKDHDTEGARKWLTQAVRLGSQRYLVNFEYARIEMNDGKLSDAAAVEASLKAAIHLNPDFAPAYDRLSRLYHMQHEHLEDAHLFELQAMQLEPANLSYRLHAAYLMLDLKREDDAMRILNAAREFAKSPEQTARIDQAVSEVQAVKSGYAEKQQLPSTPAED